MSHFLPCSGSPCTELVDQSSDAAVQIELPESLTAGSGHRRHTGTPFWLRQVLLKDAYLHVPLDEVSQKYTVISTPFGLYKYKFLPLGVKSAPHIFQTKMEKLLMGLSGVHIHLDDVLLATSSDTEHDKTLAEILKRLKQAKLPVNEAKVCL